MKEYLSPATYIDSDHLEVIAYATSNTENMDSPTEKAIALFYAVRDGFRYTVNPLNLSEKNMKASHLLTRDYGYCIEKACLLAACGRAVGIPSRLSFGNVRNHIGTDWLEKLLQTNLLVFHGNTEFYLDGRWLKLTPAFNQELCDKLNVPTLEFDGTQDCIFQAYDKEGGKFMEYVHDYGHFSDVPRDKFLTELAKHYGHIFNTKRKIENVFQAEDS